MAEAYEEVEVAYLAYDLDKLFAALVEEACEKEEPYVVEEEPCVVEEEAVFHN